MWATLGKGFERIERVCDGTAGDEGVDAGGGVDIGKEG